MPVWLEIERKLAQAPSNHPARLRFLYHVNFYGQVSELDPQGRVLIQPRLRESALMTGEVDVLGNYDFLEVWNHDRFLAKLIASRIPTTTRGPWPSSASSEAPLFTTDVYVSHLPVMVDEAMRFLEPRRGGTYVDCTVGLGGHARALLDGGAIAVIGIDRDAQALALTAEALARGASGVRLVHADYRDLDAVLDGRGGEWAGRSPTLACRRCSSTRRAAASASAATSRSTCEWIRRGARPPPIVCRRRRDALADVIFHFGEERKSRRIARAIVAARDGSRSRRPASSRRSSGGRRGAAGSGSTRRRALSRRCGSGSTPSSRGSTTSCAAAAGRLVPVAGWW